MSDWITVPHWEVQNSELEPGLVGKEWPLLYWPATPASLHESQASGWARLDKTAAPITMHVDWAVR